MAVNGTAETGVAILRELQARQGWTAVPFGWSTEGDREAWRRERWSAAAAGVPAERLESARAATNRAHEIAYAYAIGWCEGRFRIVDGRRIDGESWDFASTLALRFADEYERQEFLWVLRTVPMNTKRGYGLWWNEIVRAHGLV